MKAARSRIILYVLLMLAPLLVVAVFHLKTEDVFFYNLGRGFAQLAFAIIVLQVVLASRLRWVERPFGLNLTFPFHRRMGTVAAILLLLHPPLMALGGGGWLLLHPPLMALGGGGWNLIYSFNVDWYILLAKAALALLLINVGISLWRVRLGIKFEQWRLWHDILGPLVLVLAFVHSWYASEDFKVRPMQAL
ncbi:MAG: ferric reductase-like transmembrane domain-containing protein [Deltaproteobacteria bacterium]|nr:ferric reductase-like transmembrane domain-containing protein [Deltaproteobacteria bacterium]